MVCCYTFSTSSLVTPYSTDSMYTPPCLPEVSPALFSQLFLDLQIKTGKLLFRSLFTRAGLTDSSANWNSGLSDFMSSSYLRAADCTATGGSRGGCQTLTHASLGIPFYLLKQDHWICEESGMRWLSNIDTCQFGFPSLLLEARPLNLWGEWHEVVVKHWHMPVWVSQSTFGSKIIESVRRVAWGQTLTHASLGFPVYFWKQDHWICE